MDPERPRTPNFNLFLLVGAVIGFAVGAAFAILGPTAANYTTATAIGYLGVFGAIVGLGAGAIVALVLDWARHRSGPQA